MLQGHQHVAQELSESSGSTGAAHEILRKQQQQDMQPLHAFPGGVYGLQGTIKAM